MNLLSYISLHKSNIEVGCPEIMFQKVVVQLDVYKSIEFSVQFECTELVKCCLRLVGVYRLKVSDITRGK